MAAAAVVAMGFLLAAAVAAPAPLFLAPTELVRRPW